MTSMMTPTVVATYVEDFNNGAGGWIQITGNGTFNVRPIEIEGGAAISRSPWWIDYNHAPPGAGYLHLLFALHTEHPEAFPDHFKEVGGRNPFVENGFPLDFTNARITFRLKGDLELRGAQLLFLAQARVGQHIAGHLLTGQPLEVGPDWCEQTVTLVPDPAQWTCLGVRHDRGETYAWADVQDVLRCLNVDFMLVLNPLDIVPDDNSVENVHILKAGEDYEVDRSRLPSGHVMLDWIKIEFIGQ